MLFRRSLVESVCLVMLVHLLLGPGQASAQTDVLIDFSGTGTGAPLQHGDAISGHEWLPQGVRFTGLGMQIVNDASCNACLAGDVAIATFEINGLPAVTGELLVNHVDSPNAFTVVRDVAGTVLFQGAGDVSLTAPNIASVEMRFGVGATGFGFDAVTPTPARPICDIQMSQAEYVTGDTVSAQVFRLANTSTTPTTVEWKMWLVVPGVAPISSVNLTTPLPPSFDVDLGPVALFPVLATAPRGPYEFSCRMLNPVTGQRLAEDRNLFLVR